MIKSLLGNIFFELIFDSDSVSVFWLQFWFVILDLKTQVEETLLLCHRADLMLTEWKWECLSGAFQLLEPCQFLTAVLNSSKYPSVSKVLPAAKLLKHTLEAISSTNHHDALIMMSSNLRLNIGERLMDYRLNVVHLILTYLDPR